MKDIFEICESYYNLPGNSHVEVYFKQFNSKYGDISVFLKRHYTKDGRQYVWFERHTYELTRG